MNFLKNILYKIRGEVTTDELIKNGMKVGKNFHRMHSVILDPGHCWHISIGDNVTLAPRVFILCHDASLQAFMHCTKIGNVNIGNNVFIGANTTVLPGVNIGDNVIIGAGSVVAKDIPSNSLACGNPCKVISTLDNYINRITEIRKTAPIYGKEYTMYGGITNEMKQKMIKDLNIHKKGFLG